MSKIIKTSNILTVTEFNTFLKEVVSSLGYFRIRGEITEISKTSRGGVYITLSDKNSTLKLSGYAPNIKGIKQIEKGMNVVILGSADIYIPYGSFSLKLIEIEPEGRGSLIVFYQKLKKDLEQEGLFEMSRKRKLPDFITKIALITGKDSSAYADFTKIIDEHNSLVEIDFYPAIVQGEYSTKSITNCLDAIENCTNTYDCIALVRGGGSLEDLKSFNDEILIRRLFALKIPTIVGVGHEDDETLCDFVADVRASTPSQASYYIVKHNENYFNRLYEILDSYKERNKLKANDLNSKLELLEADFKNLIRNKIRDVYDLITNHELILDKYSIHDTLKRGFITVEKNNRRIYSKASLNKDDFVKLNFYDGVITAKVN